MLCMDTGIAQASPKGGVECGKETNTHFFFSEPWLTPSPHYLPNRVCFFHSYVFGVFFRRLLVREIILNLIT